MLRQAVADARTGMEKTILNTATTSLRVGIDLRSA